MLKVFRDNLKYLSWILWAVILVFVAFVFVDFGGGISRDPSAPASYAATVGNQEISVDEFRQTYRALEGQYRQLYGERFSPEIAKQMQLPMQALERAVSQKVLQREAEQRGLVPSDDEVRAAILRIEAFQDGSGNFIGDQEYAALLRSNGHSPASFERALRGDLAVEKLTSTLRRAVHVSDQQLERSFREQADRAAIRYVQVPAARFAAQVALRPAEVRAYFDAHPDEFKLPEQRVADYLLVDQSQVYQALTIPENDIQAYYDSHAAEYAREEEVRARHVLIKVDDARTAEAAESLAQDARRRLAAGEDFAVVAQQLSDDPGSKQNGGDLGFFGRGAMIKAFEDAAFGAQTGELVGPVLTDFGYHVIRVDERRPSGQQPFAEARPLIENRLRTERAQAAAEAKARALYDQLKSGAADASTMQNLAAADAATVTFHSTPAFGADDALVGIGRATPLHTAAFALETGKAAEPVRLPRGMAVVVLREIRPPHAAQFDEVEALVKTAAETRRRKELATASLTTAVAAARAGKSLDTIATELGVAAQDSGEFGANGSIQGLGVAPAVTKAAVALAEGEFGGPVETPQGAVIFQVTSRARFDPAEFSTKKEETRQTLEGQALNELLGALIERQRQDLGVNYNRQLLEDWGIMVPETEPAR